MALAETAPFTLRQCNQRHDGRVQESIVFARSYKKEATLSESVSGRRANHYLWIVVAILMFAPDVRAQNTFSPQLVQDAGGGSGTTAVGKADPDDQPPTNAKTEQPEEKAVKKAKKKTKKKSTTKDAAADSSEENVK